MYRDSKAVAVAIFFAAGIATVHSALRSNQTRIIYATVSGIPTTSIRASRTNCPTHGVWHKPLASFRRLVRDIPIIDSQEAVIINAKAGLTFSSRLLSDNADLGLLVRVVLEVVAIDLLPVKKLTDRLDVLFQSSVRTEEPTALLLGCGVARQRTSAFSDVRQELGGLEGIALLLLELLIFGSIFSLLCLLRQSASGNLSLRACQSSVLRRTAKVAKLLTARQLTRQISSNNALLTHSSLDRCVVATLIDGCDSLPHGKVLLALQLSALQSRTITAKSTALDGLRLLIRKLHPLLLLERTDGRIDNSLSERVLVVANLILCQRAYILHSSFGGRGCILIEGLRHL